MFERWVENELLNLLEQEGLGCIAFSPLAQGLLSDRYLNGIPSDSRAALPHGFLRKEQITPQLIEMIRGLNDIAIMRGQSLAQMAIAWLLKDYRVTSVLVGASSVDQLMDNVKSIGKLTFEQEEIRTIDFILNKQ